MINKTLAFISLAVLAVFLSGCAPRKPVVIPPSDSFSPPPQNGDAIILFTAFDSDGPTINKFAFGTNNRYFKMGLYDLTRNHKLVGYVAAATPQQYRKPAYSKDWVEYRVSPGKYTMMRVIVYSNNKPWPDLYGRNEEFMTIDVKPNSVNYITMNRVGFTGMPEFQPVTFSNKDFKYCSSLQGLARDDKHKAIEAYMEKSGVNERAQNFSSFCYVASLHRTINRPSKYSQTEHRQALDYIKGLYEEEYKDWSILRKTREPLDLSKPTYEEPDNSVDEQPFYN